MRPLKFRVRYANTWCVIELEKGITEFGYTAYMECVQRGERFYQFTGLLDKNGKELYEGDIIKTDLGTTGDIQFSHGVIGVEWVGAKEDKTMVGSWGQLHNLRTLDDGKIAGKSEVIGNIVENPELLK